LKDLDLVPADGQDVKLSANSQASTRRTKYRARGRRRKWYWISSLL